MNESNCSTQNCPHAELLAQARAACIACNSTKCEPSLCPNESILGKARAACLHCPRGREPAGRGGTISFDKAGELVVNREAKYIDRSPRGQVTSLPLEQEERIADIMRKWVMLTPQDILLIHHICNGGKVSTFGAYLAATRKRIDQFKNITDKSFRATAWGMWQVILDTIPTFKALEVWYPNNAAGNPNDKIPTPQQITDRGKKRLDIEMRHASQLAKIGFSNERRKYEREIAELKRRVREESREAKRANEELARTRKVLDATRFTMEIQAKKQNHTHAAGIVSNEQIKCRARELEALETQAKENAERIAFENYRQLAKMNNEHAERVKRLAEQERREREAKAAQAESPTITEGK